MFSLPVSLFPDGTSLSKPELDLVVARNIRVPMRDGVVLATDIHFPAHGVDRLSSPLPVILLRTPYDKNGSAGLGSYYARRGYILIAQDVRGRNASEGEFFPFADEGEDGCDTMDWIVRQPWCNGKIGTLGASYCAAAQSALASFDPPGLSAMIVQFGPSSYFHSSMRHNGVLELRFLVYAFNMAASSREANANPELRKILSDASDHAWDYIKAGPLRPGTTPLSLVPSYERWAIEVLTRAAYDEFWQRPGFGPLPYYDRHADVPTLYVGGWYDTYTRGTLENFCELSARKTRPVHVLMGPWTHGGVGVGEAGDALFTPDGRIDFEAVRLQWFDHWLKGIDQGLENRPPVTYFLMGSSNSVRNAGKISMGGDWHQCQNWPPEHTAEHILYLHADGSLSESSPGTADAGCVAFVADPESPVPTIGGNLSAMPLPAGAFHQVNDPRFSCSAGNGLPLSSRNDVLVFQTDPFPQDRDLIGPVHVSLQVSSDAPDTDFTAKLLVVYPPAADRPGGLAINLTDGIARLRFHAGYEKEEPVPPNTVCQLDFEIFPTACRIPAGARLRVDIAGSNYPRFELNPNTGEACGRHRVSRRAVNSVHCTPDAPSRVSIHLRTEQPAAE